MIRPHALHRRECHLAVLGMVLFGVVVTPFNEAYADHRPEAVKATVRHVLADGYFQAYPPGQREAASQAADTEPAALAERPAGTDFHGPEPVDLRTPSAAAQIGTAFLWALTGVAGVLLALQTFRLLRSRVRREQRADTPPGMKGVGTAAPDEPPLTVADRLAQTGQAADAVRRLMLDALDRLRHRAGGATVAPSRTAREIMRIPMPPRARATLSILVESEERSRFGGRVVGLPTYRACRACYVRFTSWLGAPTP